MNDELNNQVVCVSIKAGKLTGRVMVRALQAVLRTMKSGVKKGLDQKSAVGKTTMKKLMRQSGGNVTNIEISDQNIKSFDPVARKFGLKYSLQKTGNGRYLVFFKASSVDAMTAAFQEYTRRQTKKADRPSLRSELKKLVEQVKNMAQVKSKHKDRGVER